MKKLLSALLVVCMLVSVCAFGSFTAAADKADKPIQIKLTTTNASTNPEVVAMGEACERIRERTDGMIDIQLYSDGQMLVYAEGIEAVMSNSAVIYFTACNLFADYVPEFTTVSCTMRRMAGPDARSQRGSYSCCLPAGKKENGRKPFGLWACWS